MAAVVVLGGGGFIGGHLALRLRNGRHDVTCVDIKPLPEWCQVLAGVTNIDVCDLSTYQQARKVMESKDFEAAFLLAANMGGISWITHQPLECILSVDISSSCLKAARDTGVRRLFYSSSACAYPVRLQADVDSLSLSEDMTWQGRAEFGYGEEKLFTESLCEIFNTYSDLETRVARFHNIYGPYTSFDGGREKAPAAICRKVIEAKLSGNHTIEIWGDGEQTRSFCYVDDCIAGIIRIMNSDYTQPLNLGSSELVTVNTLVSIVEEIADIKLKRVYNLDAPQGVRGRNSDNTLINQVLNWEPRIKLSDGMKATYDWIWREINSA